MAEAMLGQAGIAVFDNSCALFTQIAIRDRD
jgi:hypothetical protein